jgi:autotransporter-associated beta strand protein
MKSGNNRFLPLALIGSSLALATSALATDYTWGGGNGNWSATNWTPGPVAGNLVVGSANTATINGAVTVEGDFKTFGNLLSITVSGATLNLYNSKASVDTFQTYNNLILAGGTITGSNNFGNFGAGNIRRVTVTGTSPSTMSSGSDPNGYFNLRDISTGVSPFFDVQDATGNLNVTARLADTAASSAAWTPTGFEKKGAGTMTLSNTNTYAGATTITQGKLVINGSISTSTLTTVKTTGTLGGSGFAGAVSVESGGTLAPGNSIDQFDTKTLTLASGSIFQVEIDTAASYDQVGITGNLNIIGGAKLDLVDLGSPDLIALYSRLTIMDYSGAWNSGLFTLGTEELSDSETFAWQSKTWRINYDDILGVGETSLSSGGTAVTLTVVPEPNVAALLGGLGMLALLRRRRA